MSPKLPVNGFMWYNDHLSDFNEDFIRNYNENSDEGYFPEIDIEYPQQLWSSNKDLPFLPERRRIEKVEKLVCSIEDKEKYVIHIRALKQALNNGLKLKQVHRVIKFQQKAWLKLYIDMNTKLSKKAKNKFEKDFLKLMNNSVLGKTMENVRKHRDIRLVTTEKRRIKLVSEPNYHTTKLCYMDTDSFVLNIFTEDFFEDINNDVERWFDTSNYDKNDKRPIRIGVNKKVIGMFKDELG